MRKYYLVENGQQFGPFIVEELKSKQLKRSTPVWTDGMANWATSDSVDELQGFFYLYDGKLMFKLYEKVPKRSGCPDTYIWEVRTHTFSRHGRIGGEASA